MSLRNQRAVDVQRAEKEGVRSLHAVLSAAPTRQIGMQAARRSGGASPNDNRPDGSALLGLPKDMMRLVLGKIMGEKEELLRDPSVCERLQELESFRIGYYKARTLNKTFKTLSEEHYDPAHWIELYKLILFGPDVPMSAPPFDAIVDPSKGRVINVLRELCETSATVEEMWRWNPHPEATSNSWFPSKTDADPHELDKRLGQAIMHNRLALASVLAFRGGDHFRRTIRWLNNETIITAVSEMHPVTGGHPVLGPIGWWATGKVTDMSGLFFDRNDFNGDLSGWDVSNVEDMSSMFAYVEAFKGVGLDQWRPSKRLTDTEKMFLGATQFDADLGAWDVSGVEAMGFMFSYAVQFNADLGAWDVSKVGNMGYMFQNATTFKGFGLHRWRPSNELRGLGAMFLGATQFDADLGEWNVSGVRHMTSMFQNATAFKGRGLHRWRPSGELKGTPSMFFGATQFDADLGEWDVSGVRHMTGMFQNATAFKGRGLHRWRPSGELKGTPNMFFGATQFDADLGEWDVSGVRYMHGMFKDATAFKGRGLRRWRPSNRLETTDSMFEGATQFDADLGKWDVSKVKDMSRMFVNATAFTGRVPNGYRKE